MLRFLEKSLILIKKIKFYKIFLSLFSINPRFINSDILHPEGIKEDAIFHKSKDYKEYSEIIIKL